MKIEVNVEKRHVFLITGLIVLFGGLFLVNAYGGSAPAVMGHTGGEIVSVDWSQITNKPSTLDGGIAWSEIVSKPAGFADNVDNTGIVGTITEFPRMGMSTSIPSPQVLGVHKFCFLNEVTINGNGQCMIYKSGSNWMLGAYVSARCDAYCVD